jgi:phosphoglycerate kinase
MKSINDATDLSGKRILLRASLNVPMKDGKIIDTTRIDEALQTIQFLRGAGAKMIMISHTSDSSGTLRPVFDYLKERLPISFVEDIRGAEAKKMINSMADGEIVLAENLRQYPEEEQNDRVFAAELAALADVFVNDDFTVSHRTHASTVGVAELLPSYAGLTFDREYSFLSQILEAPAESLAIIGGGKPETKLPLIVSLAEKMTTVAVCGISANAIWQSRGLPIGKSATAKETIPEIATVNAASNIHLPSDVRIVDGNGNLKVIAFDSVPEDAAIVDAGPQTLHDLGDLISKAAFILWNGPLGEYEKGYTTSTHALAHLLAESGKRVIVGGGDTVAAITHLELPEKFTYLSTSGGAMIDYLAHGTLPGIEALNK